MREVVAEIDKAIPDEDRVIALDRVLASVDRSQIVPERNVAGREGGPARDLLQPDRRPSSVNLDGEPIWSPIDRRTTSSSRSTRTGISSSTGRRRPSTCKRRSLAEGGDLKGPGRRRASCPRASASSPADDELEGSEGRAARTRTIDPGKAPKVFVSSTPAEMILLDRRPAVSAGRGHVASSGSATPRATSSASGSKRRRSTTSWPGAGSRAPGFDGPWTFATPTLPADFQKIPLEHPRSRVLASVPGRSRRRRRVLPRPGAPDRAREQEDSCKAPGGRLPGRAQVRADREDERRARRQHRQETSSRSATSTTCGYEGVWFMRAAARTVPGTVSRPRYPKEIYEIPISSPVPQRHLRDVSRDDDDAVGHLRVPPAMYTGVMVAWGCAVWGSGWLLPAVLRRLLRRLSAATTVSYPTYGYGASVQPVDGRVRPTAVAYGPYWRRRCQRRATTRAPVTYSRGAAAYGPVRCRAPPARPTTRRTGAYGQTRQGSNVYGSWAATSVGPARARPVAPSTNRTGLYQPRHRRHRPARRAAESERRRRHRPHPVGPGRDPPPSAPPAATCHAGRDGQRPPEPGRLAGSSDERQRNWSNVDTVRATTPLRPRRRHRPGSAARPRPRRPA